jgi:hypothetical protein
MQRLNRFFDRPKVEKYLFGKEKNKNKIASGLIRWLYITELYS